MKRTEFEHALRAAAAVLGVDELLVIGSQALHGAIESDLPEEALRSIAELMKPCEDGDVGESIRKRIASKVEAWSAG